MSDCAVCVFWGGLVRGRVMSLPPAEVNIEEHIKVIGLGFSKDRAGKWGCQAGSGPRREGGGGERNTC